MLTSCSRGGIFIRRGAKSSVVCSAKALLLHHSLLRVVEGMAELALVEAAAPLLFWNPLLAFRGVGGLVDKLAMGGNLFEGAAAQGHFSPGRSAMLINITYNQL